MADGTSLYDSDFVLWSEQQADAIRHAAASGTNLPLDWENIAEEIEGLGKSLRSELRSRLGAVIEHLLKLDHSPAIEPRAGWIETIGRARIEIDQLLDDNPSLRSGLTETVERAHRLGRKTAKLSFERFGEADAEQDCALLAGRYTVEQLIGDWLPPPRG